MRLTSIRGKPGDATDLGRIYRYERHPGGSWGAGRASDSGLGRQKLRPAGGLHSVRQACQDVPRE